MGGASACTSTTSAPWVLARRVAHSTAAAEVGEKSVAATIVRTGFALWVPIVLLLRLCDHPGCTRRTLCRFASPLLPKPRSTSRNPPPRHARTLRFGLCKVAGRRVAVRLPEAAGLRGSSPAPGSDPTPSGAPPGTCRRDRLRSGRRVPHEGPAVRTHGKARLRAVEEVRLPGAGFLCVAVGANLCASSHKCSAARAGNRRSAVALEAFGASFRRREASCLVRCVWVYPTAA